MKRIICMIGAVAMLSAIAGCKKYYYPATTQEFDPGVVVEEHTVVE